MSSDREQLGPTALPVHRRLKSVSGAAPCRTSSSVERRVSPCRASCDGRGPSCDVRRESRREARRLPKPTTLRKRDARRRTTRSCELVMLRFPGRPKRAPHGMHDARTTRKKKTRAAGHSRHPAYVACACTPREVVALETGRMLRLPRHSDHQSLPLRPSLNCRMLGAFRRRASRARLRGKTSPPLTTARRAPATAGERGASGGGSQRGGAPQRARHLGA